jgi:hypothetical protein
VARLRGLLAQGSYLAVSHGAREHDPGAASGIEQAYRRTGGRAVLRTRAELASIMDGCPLLDPGIVYAAQWHPGSSVGDPGMAMTLAALARL